MKNWFGHRRKVALKQRKANEGNVKEKINIKEETVEKNHKESSFIKQASSSVYFKNSIPNLYNYAYNQQPYKVLGIMMFGLINPLTN